jgi:hypothetical protein
MEQEIADALELAAGMRIRSDGFRQQTATRNEIAITKKQIMLFLEAVPGELSISEVMHVLSELD